MIYLLTFSYLIGVFMAYQSLDPKSKHAMPKLRFVFALLYPIVWGITLIVIVFQTLKRELQGVNRINTDNDDWSFGNGIDCYESRGPVITHTDLITVNGRPVFVDPEKDYSYDDIISLAGYTPGYHATITVDTKIDATNTKGGYVRHGFSVCQGESTKLKADDRINAYNTGNA